MAAFVRRRMVPRLPPPRVERGLIAWLRWRLFATPLQAALTLVSLAVLITVLWPAIRFLVVDAVWQGDTREACLGATGACWPFVKAKFGQLIYGFYPAAERWRPDLVFALGAILLAPLLVPAAPLKGLNAVLFFAVYPVLSFILLVGGSFGLEHVETRRWGGLLITLVVAFTGIIASLPLGILLALGRRSELPVV
ncbi:MAG TPA: amino acid ABC transporter permease, partial [Xanthobacteraceae bacterium]|nr:amino acid ABC transporter permease [Xanthobacteraceae bacterium]